VTSLGIAPGVSTGVVVRSATPADDAARRSLFARVAMDTDLVLSVRRDPEFDALYRIQNAEWESVVVEIDGAIEGMGTVLVRDGYIGGERRRVGYLGDLRLSSRAEGRSLLDRFYAPLLAAARERWGCELFLTAVIASNERALRALTRETGRSRRARRPQYMPVGDFDIRSIHLLLPKRRERSAYRVRRARLDDLAAIAGLLDRDARARPFGYPMDERELSRRLREWPGLGIDSFLLAEDARGTLVGCIALWDASPVKRTLVMEYRGAMRRVRLGYDLAAVLLGMAKLPAPGDALRYLYVTHQAVPSGDPGVLRALLCEAYRMVRGSGHQVLSACAPLGSSLAPAFRGFQATDLRARLFVVSLPDVEVPSELLNGAWPGFEMALV
jgi:hypothetical protein